jgi:hypothetical protein
MLLLPVGSLGCAQSRQPLKSHYKDLQRIESINAFVDVYATTLLKGDGQNVHAQSISGRFFRMYQCKERDPERESHSSHYW